MKNLCLVYLSITPPDLSTYSVDTLLLTFLNFARFSLTTTLNISVQNIKYTATLISFLVCEYPVIGKKLYTFEPPLTVYGYLSTIATLVVSGWLRNHQLSTVVAFINL